jgi:hypothetical protein
MFFFCLAFQFYVNVTKAKERIIFVAYIIHGLSGFFDTMKYRNFLVQRNHLNNLDTVGMYRVALQSWGQI